MAATRCACPSCARPLKMPPADSLPARAKCPQCAARFVVNRDGSTAGELQAAGAASAPAGVAVARAAMAPPPLPAGREHLLTEAPPTSNTGLLVGLAVAAVLLLGGGIALAVIAFSGGDETPRAEAGTNENDSDPANPANRLVAEPVRPAKKPRPVDPKVKAAIDRGVVFLKEVLTGKRDVKGRNNFGAVALAGLSLLSCGVPANDPAVVKVAQLVRAKVGRLDRTYDLAICIWFLDKLNDPRDQETIQSVALRLIASQGVNGGWNYTSYPLAATRQSQLLALIQSQPLQIEDEKIEKPADKKAPARAKKGGKKARAAQKAAQKNRKVGTIPADLHELPVMRFQPGKRLAFHPPKGHEDNSLTQFVILALWAAQKHGVPADRSLAFVEARFRASQNPDGSWGYAWVGGRNNRVRAHSMTCAGLLGLAVGRGVRDEAKLVDGKKQSLTQDPAVAKALAFLGKDIIGKPGRRGRGFLGASAGDDLYFLWSLERVGVVYNIHKIAGKDWYDWGSKLIVGAQQADGSWQGSYGLADTSFALLFLNRVNVVEDLTSKLQKLEPPAE